MTRSRRGILLAAVTLLWASVPALRADSLTLTPEDNDVRILSAGPNTNYHGEDFLTVYNNGGNNVQHSLLQFDLSDIPPNQTIDFAVLTIWRDSQIWGGGDNGLPANVYRVTTPWVNTEATWNTASAGTPWTTPGGDYVGTTGAQATNPYASNMLNIAGSGGPDTSGIFPLFFVVTPLVSQWYNGVNPNYGLLLEAPAGNELHFRADRSIPNPMRPHDSPQQLFPSLKLLFH
jgi:hypothetical protein